MPSTDSLAAALSEIEASAQNLDICSFGRIAKEIGAENPELGEKVLEMGFNPIISVLSLVTALQANGHKITRGTIASHRRKACLCTRNTND